MNFTDESIACTGRRMMRGNDIKSALAMIGTSSLKESSLRSHFEYWKIMRLKSGEIVWSF